MKKALLLIPLFLMSLLMLSMVSAIQSVTYDFESCPDENYTCNNLTETGYTVSYMWQIGTFLSSKELLGQMFIRQSGDHDYPVMRFDELPPNVTTIKFDVYVETPYDEDFTLFFNMNDTIYNSTGNNSQRFELDNTTPKRWSGFFFHNDFTHDGESSLGYQDSNGTIHYSQLNALIQQDNWRTITITIDWNTGLIKQYDDPQGNPPSNQVNSIDPDFYGFDWDSLGDLIYLSNTASPQSGYTSVYFDNFNFTGTGTAIPSWDGSCDADLHRTPCTVTSDLTLNGQDLIINPNVTSGSYAIRIYDNVTFDGNGSELRWNTSLGHTSTNLMEIYGHNVLVKDTEYYHSHSGDCLKIVDRDNVTIDGGYIKHCGFGNGLWSDVGNGSGSGNIHYFNNLKIDDTISFTGRGIIYIDNMTQDLDSNDYTGMDFSNDVVTLVINNSVLTNYDEQMIRIDQSAQNLIIENTVFTCDDCWQLWLIDIRNFLLKNNTFQDRVHMDLRNPTSGTFLIEDNTFNMHTGADYVRLMTNDKPYITMRNNYLNSYWVVQNHAEGRIFDLDESALKDTWDITTVLTDVIITKTNNIVTLTNISMTNSSFNFSEVLEIGDQYVSIDSGSDLDVRANLLFDNLPLNTSLYLVKKDGVTQSEGTDYNLTLLDVDTIAFNVSGFSNWSIEYDFDNLPTSLILSPYGATYSTSINWVYFMFLGQDIEDYNLTGTMYVDDVIEIQNTTLINNSPYYYNFTGLTPDSYIIKFEVCDSVNCTNSTALNMTIGNSAPIINSYTPINLSPSIYDVLTLDMEIIATDYNNDTLTYAWYIDASDQNESSSTFTFGRLTGTYEVQAWVSDGYLSDTQNWTVTVISTPPYIAQYSGLDIDDVTVDLLMAFGLFLLSVIGIIAVVYAWRWIKK